jgi:hypothetical protein
MALEKIMHKRTSSVFQNDLIKALFNYRRGIILVIILSFYGPIFAQPAPKSQLWSENLELEWRDFNGAPEAQVDAVAITASGITFGYSVTTSDTKVVDANFTIEAHFYPDHSWFKKTRVTPVVLDHERFHFNITELFARKFRQRIAKTRFTNAIQEEVDVIYDAINQELKALQTLYDQETNYSIDIEAQKRWQVKVEKELQELSKYKLD